MSVELCLSRVESTSSGTTAGGQIDLSWEESLHRLLVDVA